MDEIVTERQRDYRTAEWYLLRYDVERQRYDDEKAQAMSRPADENAGRRGAISRPTEAAALQSIKFDLDHGWIYKWLTAVEVVERNLIDSKRYFVRLRRAAYRQTMKQRGRGRRAWVQFVQSRYSNMAGREVSEITVKRWHSDIVWRVVDAHLRIERNSLDRRKENAIM